MTSSVRLSKPDGVATGPWLIATRNEGKKRELRLLLAREGIVVTDLDEAGITLSAEEEGLESFPTFEENALAKARFFAARSGGQLVVADDSGLEVCALSREPGVRSKRWGGSDLTGHELEAANNELLRARLSGVTDRRARFVCAAACSFEGTELVTSGHVEGVILERPSGVHGFGYDPYFWSNELRMTLSDASVLEKQSVSHRARAFRALVAQLRAHEMLQ